MLETDGNPPVQPFPTSIPSITASTLQPLPSSASFEYTTSTPESTITQTMTAPITTFETIIVTSTATSIPAETTITVTTESIISITYTENGSTVTTTST